MEIENAKIKNVTVGFDDRDRLSVRMTFAGQCNSCDYGFILTNPNDVQRLIRLMNYVEAYEINDLDGMIIRKVTSGHLFRGFGHPIEDLYIPNSEEFKEIKESDFAEL